MNIAFLPKNKQVASEKTLFNLKLNKILISNEMHFHEILNSPKLWCAYVGKEQDLSNIDLFIHEEIFLLNKLREKIKGRCFIVIINKEEETITVIRDNIGMQHLYYFSNKNMFFLSDNIVELIDLIGKTNININEKAIELYLTFQYIPSPYTLIKEISQVPLNSYILYKNGNILEKRLKNNILYDRNQKESLKENNLLNILNESILSQGIFSFKKPAAFLSGGMDTSSNVSLMVNEFNIRPIAFTAVFENSDYSELEYAEFIAKKFSLDHHICHIGPESINKIRNMVSAFDNPIADRAALAQYVISEQAKKVGVDCMISGEGGDEILGYPRNLPDYFIPNDNYSTVDLAKLYLNFSALNNEKNIAELVGKNIENLKTYEYLSNLYASFKEKSSLEKIYYGQWQTWLIDNVLMKDYQIFKNFSLGYIAPFISENLMIHMANQSTYKKSSLLKDKNYLKHSLNNMLAEKTVRKNKQKFELPMDAWMRGPLKKYLKDEFLVSGLPIYKFIDIKVVNRLFNEHVSGESDHNRSIWSLLILNSWYESKVNKK